MKYLLVLAVVVVAWMVWRAQRRADTPPAAPPQPKAKLPPQDMVACAVCGVHLPRGDAITGARGTYCSDDHRRRAGD